MRGRLRTIARIQNAAAKLSSEAAREHMRVAARSRVLRPTPEFAATRMLEAIAGASHD
jgi:hypothetical protein